LAYFSNNTTARAFCTLLLKERVTILEQPKPDALLSGREPTFLLGGDRYANCLLRWGPSRRVGVLLLRSTPPRGAWNPLEGLVGGDGKREMELERIREAAERVARSVGIDVVDVEWKVGKQRFLRVYIDKPDGISHRDCETVSNQLSVILDVEDLVPGPHYILEVSSPGLDRKLTKPAEFERFAGRLARISTLEPVENQKFFEGRLAGVAGGKVQIEVKGRVIALPMEGIRKANLVVEF
jgi:ribosome maturation factor RimP